jgi:hypothetical protein
MYVCECVCIYVRTSMYLCVYEYIPGRHNERINKQTVYTATTQDAMRILTE